MADLSRFISTPAQTEALAAALQRIDRLAQEAADNMVEAFAAAARQLELERRKRPSFTVIVPTKSTAGWLGRWLFAPNPVPTNFGRKRRARRARGRRIEARRNTPYVGGRIWLASAGRMLHSKPIGPTTRLGNVEIPTCIDDSFLAPSLGEPWDPNCVPFELAPCRHISVGYAGLPSERREAAHEAHQDSR